MGASESKTDDIDVDVDVADAPADKTPTPINSTLSEAVTSADDAKPTTPEAVYRTADAPEADPLAVYGTADGAEEKKTPPAGKTPAQFPPAKPAVKPRRSDGLDALRRQGREGVRLEAARARGHGGGRDGVRGARRSAGRRARLPLVDGVIASACNILASTFALCGRRCFVAALHT